MGFDQGSEPIWERMQMSRQIGLRVAAIALVTALSATSALGQKMYWTDSFANRVQRANLDGSDVEDLGVS